MNHGSNSTMIGSRMAEKRKCFGQEALSVGLLDGSVQAAANGTSKCEQ